MVKPHAAFGFGRLQNSFEQPRVLLPIHRPSDQLQLPRWGNPPHSLFLIPIHLILVCYDALAAVRR